MAAGGPAPDGGAAAPPSVEDLLAIGPDLWARVLRHVRAAWNEADDEVLGPEALRLRTAPTSRLAGGRTRRRLAAELAGGGASWVLVHERLSGDEQVVADLPWLVEGGPASSQVAAPSDGTKTPPDPAAVEAAARAKRRARELRQERDQARRRAEGAEARASALEGTVASLSVDLERAQQRISELEDRLAAAADERSRAVDRERRRNDAEVAELEQQLRRLRRREDDRRGRRRAAADRATPAPQRAEPRPAAATADPGIPPGRPTRVPSGIRPGTAEHAEALLSRGRLVLIDGYNVTKQHRGHLSLEEQRTWLIRLLSSVVTGRKLRPTVVFDGDEPVGPAGRLPRGVSVRFTPPGVTADDEIDFSVAALDPDEPVVVVTDDRELQERVRVHGADVLGTGPFLWAVG